MHIKGKIEYDHLPYDEEGAFTYCKHCKETCDDIIVEFHEGWVGDWINVRCVKCKKSIWTSKLNKEQTKDDKKCTICKVPTNWIDCVCKSSKLGTRGWDYICSDKCLKEYDKLEESESNCTQVKGGSVAKWIL